MKNRITDHPENDTDTKETQKSENNNTVHQILNKLDANDRSRGLSYFAVYTFQ